MEKTFARLLSEGIHRIRIREAKTVQIVQDELGYALGREGGSAIQYWRKGHVPARQPEIEALARAVVKRGRLERSWLEEFLHSAGYQRAADLVEDLFPGTSSPAAPVTAAAAGTEWPRPPAPFIAGPPISHPYHFFGRERELKRIFGLLQRFPLQNVAVVGAYRSGKTSLLHYLQRITRSRPEQLRPGQRADWLPQAERYRWAFVDFQDSRMRQRLSLLAHLLHCLELPAPPGCDLSAFMSIVSRHLQSPAIILMDEIGAALAAPELDQEFWWSLRSLGSNLSGGNLAFILTAPAAPAQLAQEHGKPSPFFNIFGHTLKLGPLTEVEARALLASSPIAFAGDDVAWIVAQSGRWPCLLQILAYARLASLEEGEKGEGWREEGKRQMEQYGYLLE